MREHTESPDKIIKKVGARLLKVGKSNMVMHMARPKSDYSFRNVTIYTCSGEIKVHGCHHEMRSSNIKAKKGKPDLKKKPRSNDS